MFEKVFAYSKKHAVELRKKNLFFITRNGQHVSLWFGLILNTNREHTVVATVY